MMNGAAMRAATMSTSAEISAIPVRRGTRAICRHSRAWRSVQLGRCMSDLRAIRMPGKGVRAEPAPQLRLSHARSREGADDAHRRKHKYSDRQTHGHASCDSPDRWPVLLQLANRLHRGAPGQRVDVAFESLLVDLGFAIETVAALLFGGHAMCSLRRSTSFATRRRVTSSGCLGIAL